MGEGLGVVELKVELNNVLKKKYDRIIWDVGNKEYKKKIMKGRRERIRKLRKEGGI